MGWRVRGEYVENCNCELFCPCLLGPKDRDGRSMARPTEGHCEVPLLFHIEQGQIEGLSLDGLNVAMILRTMGSMADGNWTVGAYLDARASAEQQRALEAIFYGDVGGPMGFYVAPITSKRLAPRVVPITYIREGRRRIIRITDTMDMEVEGLLGGDGKSEIWLTNVRHMACLRMTSARGLRSIFKDHGFHWDHAGKNAHYGPFDWTEAGKVIDGHRR